MGRDRAEPRVIPCACEEIVLLLVPHSIARFMQNGEEVRGRCHTDHLFIRRQQLTPAGPIPSPDCLSENRSQLSRESEGLTLLPCSIYAVFVQALQRLARF